MTIESVNAIAQSAQTGSHANYLDCGTQKSVNVIARIAKALSACGQPNLILKTAAANAQTGKDRAQASAKEVTTAIVTVLVSHPLAQSAHQARFGTQTSGHAVACALCNNGCAQVAPSLITTHVSVAALQQDLGMSTVALMEDGMSKSVAAFVTPIARQLLLAPLPRLSIMQRVSVTANAHLSLVVSSSS